MAVGTVSSAVRQNAPATQPATQVPEAVVLRSGEQQASTQSALSNPDAKTFYHRVKGAKFIMPNGLELVFLGGQFTTDEADIISELSKIANKSTSMVFTMQAGIAAALSAEQQVAVDAQNTAGTLPNGA